MGPGNDNRISMNKVIGKLITALILILAGCGDRNIEEYVTDKTYKPVGLYTVESADIVSADKPNIEVMKIEFTQDKVILSDFPIYSSDGKIEKIVRKAEFKNETHVVGDNSDGKNIYGFQDSNTGVVVNYLTNDKLSITIGNPDSGEKIVYSKEK